MTKNTPLAGVIGMPIGHSRSPALHCHWLRRYGIKGHYIPMPVPEADLADTLKVLPRIGFVGVNVTIPHKEAVLALAHSTTDLARRIGAANTLTFSESGIHADNTDAFGFIENLKVGAPNWTASQGPALMIGAGGAARAVLVALLDEGVGEVRIANRTIDRSKRIAAEFGPRAVPVNFDNVRHAMEDAALLVNTTSLGMTGEPPLNVTLEKLPNSATVTDLVYTPLETPLLAAAKEHGCVTVDGLGMLLHQAVPGFERWFGRTPEVDDALRNAVLKG